MGKQTGKCQLSIAKPGKISTLCNLFGRRVAQLGSALSWGVRGRRFKSSHADQFLFSPRLSQYFQIKQNYRNLRHERAAVSRSSLKRRERFRTALAGPQGGGQDARSKTLTPTNLSLLQRLSRHLQNIQVPMNLRHERPAVTQNSKKDTKQPLAESCCGFDRA